jgi:hypothetical protein
MDAPLSSRSGQPYTYTASPHAHGHSQTTSPASQATSGTSQPQGTPAASTGPSNAVRPHNTTAQHAPASQLQTLSHASRWPHTISHSHMQGRALLPAAHLAWASTNASTSQCHQPSRRPSQFMRPRTHPSAHLVPSDLSHAYVHTQKLTATLAHSQTRTHIDTPTRTSAQPASGSTSAMRRCRGPGAAGERRCNARAAGADSPTAARLPWPRCAA